MKVDTHEPHTTLSQDDPAEFAQRSGLVNNHDQWVFGVIGAWRWASISKHRARIKELLTKGYAIDLGGAAAPVGYGAVVVDYQAPHGEPRSLADVPPWADCIFCSHTLEHFTDLENVMAAITHTLKPDGSLILLVPSWQKENLRADQWEFHEQTFCLAWEENAPAEYTRLDTLLEHWGYTIEVSETEHQNIFIIAHR